MSASAQKAKDFLLLNTSGVLSTVSASHQGYPFGSIVPYDVDSAGRFVIFISLLSEHYKNLVADSRASLLVLDGFGHHDPQAYGRATVLTRFLPVDENETELVARRYFERFPESSSRSLAHDFRYYRGEMERLRWIGGFGDIRWIEPKTFNNTSFDDVCYHGMPILEHMNEDHRSALIEIAKWQGKSGDDPVMSGLDSNGIRISLRREGKRTEIEVPFLEPVKEPREVREAIIKLLERSRAGSRL